VKHNNAPSPSDAPVIGISGPVAAGKTAVAQMLAEETGGSVISADAIAHELLEKDLDVRRSITGRWGTGCLDENGNIDRTKLAGIVFNNPDDRAELERIMHPRILQRIREDVAAARAGLPRWIILDAALLFETGLHTICDAVVFVEADLNVRAERARESRGWNRQELIRRQQAQLPIDYKRDLSHYKVNNNGSRHETKQQIKKIVQSIKRHRR